MDLKLREKVPSYDSLPTKSQFLISEKSEACNFEPSRNVSHPKGSNSSKFTRYQIIMLLSLIILQVASYASKSVIAPFFPEKARRKGVSTTMSGFIFSSYSLFMLLSAPFMSSLNRKFGIKAVMLVGIALQGTGNLLLGFWDFVESTDSFIVLCLISRIMEGIGSTAFYTSRHTFASQLFPDDVNFVLRILGVALGVGFCLGPAAGGVLFNLGGYQLPFYVLGGILLSMVPLYYYLIPGRSNAAKIEALKNEPMSKILNIKPIIMLGLVVIVISSVWEFIMATISVELIDQFFLSPSQVSIFFVVLTGTYGIFALFWGYVADRTQRIWIIITAGVFITGISMFFLGPSAFLNLRSSLAIEYVAILFWANANTMSYPLCYGASIKFSAANGYPRDENLHSFLASYNWSLYSFGGIVGPVVGSFLIEKYGFSLTCSIIGLACLFTGFLTTIYFVLIHKTPTKISNENVDHKTSETKPLL